METNDHIAFYCFNKNCENSVYHSRTARVLDLPVTVENLIHDHQCSCCHKRLVSMMDIVLRRAMCPQKRTTATRAALLR